MKSQLLGVKTESCKAALNGQQFGKLLSQLDCLHGASLSDRLGRNVGIADKSVSAFLHGFTALG